MPYLPPGWTEETLQKATPADLTLPEETLHLLSQHQPTDINTVGIIVQAQINASRLANRANSTRLVSPVPLPPGWTKERLRIATADDLRGFPEEVRRQLDVEVLEDWEAKAVVVRAWIDDDRANPRSVMGRAPKALPSPFEGWGGGVSMGAAEVTTEEGTEQFVEALERAGLDEGEPWGYFVLRITYGNERRWRRWKAGLRGCMKGVLDSSPGAERVRKGFVMETVEDRGGLDGVERSEVVGYFQTLDNHQQQKQQSEGLNIDVILAVDEDAMASLLEPVEGEEAWVWAVDLTYNFGRLEPEPSSDLEGGEEDEDEEEQEAEEDENEDDYNGTFKVTLSSLITDLYPALLPTPGGMGLEPRECVGFVAGMEDF